MENDKGIHIDVIGIGVTGSGNVIGNNITINRRQLQNIPTEYSESLKEFMKELNKFNIPPEQAKPIQDSLNDLRRRS